jgi:CHAT domain-containing protein
MTLTLALWLTCLTIFGQTLPSRGTRDLPPNQTLQREITGAEKHAYRFDLRTDEFFQVRVEQKGVDVLLKLVDTGGSVLTSMDSPNEKDGPETLTWVVTKAGSYELDVVVFDEKAGKGIYTIRRETPRMATPPDKRRVEVERLFAEGIAARDKEGQAETAIAKLKEAQHGWEELNDAYMSQLTARQISNIEEALKAPDVRVLPVGETVERRLNNGQPHIYLLKLERGQVLQVSVHEKELDVRVGFFKYGETQMLGLADSGDGYGRESLTYVADTAAAYVVLVNSFKPPSGGSYKLTAQLKEKATPTDAERIEAESFMKVDFANTRSADEIAATLPGLEKALQLWNKLGDSYWEGHTSLLLGHFYEEIGKQQESIKHTLRAAQLFRAVDDKRQEGRALMKAGGFYSVLGANQEALTYFNQALQASEAAGDKHTEGKARYFLGMVTSAMGNHQEAFDHLRHALRIFRDLHDTEEEARTLSGMGQMGLYLEQYETALGYLNPGLEKFRSINEKEGEATTLGSIGTAYGLMGKNREAFDHLARALSITKAICVKFCEANGLDNVAQAAGLLGNRRVAILYGKLAVNKFQEKRGEALGLDNEYQRSFLQRVQNSYRMLAGQLIAEGQLEQAVQIINLYRDQQFFDFHQEPSRPVHQVPYSPREQAFIDQYEADGAKVVQINRRIDGIKYRIGKGQPDEQEAAQLRQLEAEFTAASGALFATIKSAEAEFAKPRGKQDEVQDMPDVKELRSALRELTAATGQKPAALYTLILPERLGILLISPDDKIRYFESPITIGRLDELTLRFYSLLKSPNGDPRPASKELYDVLFKPVEAELQRQGVRTLMWQLDGNLRYVPVAALFDGERFLVERFQNVNFTRADRERMTRQVSRSWTGLGFGSSQEQTVDLLGNGDTITFPELPGVTRELQAIFRTGNSGAGILNGKVFVNARFTKSTFYEVMQQHPPLVHIASHFAFRPGDDSRSFLVLGDGTALTLSEMKRQKDLFAGVELLTLSACNTAATQADANGKEIDGFAELAQRLGAGAVMASLWPVADESTELLMTEFYRLRKENPLLTKAAALQLAQQKMLTGKLQSTPNDGRGSTKTVKSRADLVGTPAFPFDKTKPYAHPYYWSPFVLIGNWR